MEVVTTQGSFQERLNQTPLGCQQFVSEALKVLRE
jgi:hypothetical protein